MIAKSEISIMKRYTSLLLLAALALGSCFANGENQADSSGSSGAQSGSVSEMVCMRLNRDSLDLAVGDTFLLTWANGDSLAENSAASSDKNVAVIDSAGLITAVGVGTAKISVPVPGTRCMTFCHIRVE